MLTTTDLDITFVKAMQTYQLRWGIEVFFKDAKQKLHLGKCQGESMVHRFSTEGWGKGMLAVHVSNGLNRGRKLLVVR